MIAFEDAQVEHHAGDDGGNRALVFVVENLHRVLAAPGLDHRRLEYFLESQAIEGRRHHQHAQWVLGIPEQGASLLKQGQAHV